MYLRKEKEAWLETWTEVLMTVITLVEKIHFSHTSNNSFQKKQVFLNFLLKP